ncbi:MAG TPA: site-specific integrase, partial [Phototrophicaceae bacterium]|nr:site-specific integrase [Phototrophicaceae bacterium]
LRKEGKSEHTIKAFSADLQLLMEHQGDQVTVGQYVTHDLDQFLHWLEYERSVPCSRKSYARRVTTLKVYFKWLHILGAIAIDPAKAVIQRSGPAPLSHVLTPDQVRAVIDFSRGIRIRKSDEQDYRPELLFRLLLDTGIKKGETMEITPAEIDRLNPNRPVLNVRYKVRNVFKERNIELDSDWLKLLDLYMQQYNPKEAIFNCTSRNLEYILTDIGEGAGIPFKLSFEVMRWTCAVRDFRDGLEENHIRHKLGLSEISWHETGGKIRKLVELQTKATT